MLQESIYVSWSYHFDGERKGSDRSVIGDLRGQNCDWCGCLTERLDLLKGEFGYSSNRYAASSVS
jgi:hypothetical protein